MSLYRDFDLMDIDANGIWTNENDPDRRPHRPRACPDRTRPQPRHSRRNPRPFSRRRIRQQFLRRHRAGTGQPRPRRRSRPIRRGASHPLRHAPTARRRPRSPGRPAPPRPRRSQPLRSASVRRRRRSRLAGRLLGSRRAWAWSPPSRISASCPPGPCPGSGDRPLVSTAERARLRIVVTERGNIESSVTVDGICEINATQNKII